MVRNRTTRTLPQAFTLIELLVVISIITLLIGILLPALGAARQAGQSAVCSSNIRQLVIANLAYTVDYQNRCVLGAENFYTSNLRRWHGVRTSTTEAFDPTLGPLSSYFQDADVKECPTFGNLEIADTGQFEAGAGGYGYNMTYIGARVDLFTAFNGAAYNVSARIDDIKSPTETIMFSDAAGLSFPDGQLVEESALYTPLQVSSAGLGGQNQPTMHFRHNQATNAAWSDGHVSAHSLAFSQDPYSSIPDYQEEVLGWFGDANNDLFDLD